MALTKASLKQQVKPAPVKPAFETSWDDGSVLDLAIAYYLDEYGIKGTFYIVCDWVGKPGYLTWQQIKMLDRRGHMIGSHSMSHPADLKMLHDGQLFYEIQTSKDVIEAALGHKITSFCYPRGRADERVRQIVANAGYVNARITGNPAVGDYQDTLQKPGNWHAFQRQEYTAVNWENWGEHLVNNGAKYLNLWGHADEVNKNNLWDGLGRSLEWLRKKAIA